MDEDYVIHLLRELADEFGYQLSKRDPGPPLERREVSWEEYVGACGAVDCPTCLARPTGDKPPTQWDILRAEMLGEQ